jgi:hypothetical protein
MTAIHFILRTDTKPDIQPRQALPSSGAVGGWRG